VARATHMRDEHPLGPGLVLPTVFVTNRKGRILAVFRGDEVDALPEAVGKLLSTGQ